MSDRRQRVRAVSWLTLWGDATSGRSTQSVSVAAAGEALTNGKFAAGANMASGSPREVGEPSQFHATTMAYEPTLPSVWADYPIERYISSWPLTKIPDVPYNVVSLWSPRGGKQ